MQRARRLPTCLLVAACARSASAVCSESSSWFKKGTTSKTCEWVAAQPSTRCLAKGTDGSFAFSACRASCDTCEDKCASTSDSWVADAEQGCAWVADARVPRCAKIGSGGEYAYVGCPVECQVCDVAGCEDATSWFKANEPEKDCSWVSAASGLRCNVKGENGWAYEHCASSCGTCDVGQQCVDSVAWAKKWDPSKTCDWVALYAAQRCVTKGEDGTFGFEACPLACSLCAQNGEYDDDDDTSFLGAPEINANEMTLFAAYSSKDSYSVDTPVACDDDDDDDAGCGLSSALRFDATRYNYGDEFAHDDDEKGSCFTALHQGLYLISLHLTTDPALDDEADSSTAIVALSVNGVASGYGITVEVTRGLNQGDVIAVLKLRQNDRVTVVNSGNDAFAVNGNAKSSDEYDTFLTGFLLMQWRNNYPDESAAPLVDQDYVVLLTAYVGEDYELEADETATFSRMEMYDVFGAWDAADSSFAAPFDGMYLVSLHLAATGEDENSYAAEIFVDGVASGFGVNALLRGDGLIVQTNVAVPLKLVAGARVDVRHSGNDDFQLEMDASFVSFTLLSRFDALQAPYNNASLAGFNPPAPVVAESGIVYCVAYVGDSYELSSVAGSPVIFDQVAHDDSGAFADSTFTAPSAGVYLVSLHVTFEGAADESATVEINIDGEPSGFGINMGLEGDGELVQGNVVVPLPLTAGAQLTIVQSGNYDFTINGMDKDTDEYDTFFSVFKLAELDTAFSGLEGCGVAYPNWLGDGYCDTGSNYNTADCGWDGGDCCVSTCQEPEDSSYDCGQNNYDCKAQEPTQEPTYEPTYAPSYVLSYPPTSPPTSTPTRMPNPYAPTWFAYAEDIPRTGNRGRRVV